MDGRFVRVFYFHVAMVLMEQVMGILGARIAVMGYDLIGIWEAGLWAQV